MSDFLCKDCKHSDIEWSAYLSYIFNLGAPEPHWYKCKKFLKDDDRLIRSEPCPVTGKVVSKKISHDDLQFCSIVRDERYGKCGKDAKMWEPKNKKDLFKFLSKEQIG